MVRADTHSLTTAGLNLIQQALSIYDADLRLAICNARFAEMFDLPAALTMPGAHFEDTIRHLVTRGEYGDVDDPEIFVRDRVDTARAFVPHYMERTRANGRTISVEGTPLPQGGWVTVYTDITDVKAQEQLLRTRSEALGEEVLRRSEELAATNRELAATINALEEAKRELTEIEARTRLVTEMMPAHIAHVDASGLYTYSNRRLSTVMPGRPSQIVGMHLSQALGPETFARIKPHLDEAYSGHSSTFEFTDSQSTRRIRVVFTPDERERGAYILSMDVTEETQARAALQQTRRREIAAQLTSGLAHDFSNLLTIILGMQSKLQRLQTGPDAAPLISGTIQAAKRGGRLLNRIADMTSPSAYRPEPTELDGFLDGLKTFAEASLPDGITLGIDCQDNGTFLLDPGMVQDSLLNLILNARDACGETGRIDLQVSTVQDTWLQFRITDTGPGFTDAALTRGLDPFFTTKGSGGSGLGLSMVYDMTKLAGGEVRLANSGHGAQVTVRLPLRSAEILPQTRGDLVLLVEDNADLRADIRDMLTAMGFAVVEASSVDEACVLAEGLPGIAFVLSDITLEGDGNGTDLIDRLANLPVRLMTALPADHPLHATALRHVPVLAKPFSAQDLAGFLGRERSVA